MGFIYLQRLTHFKCMSMSCSSFKWALVGQHMMKFLLGTVPTQCTVRHTMVIPIDNHLEKDFTNSWVSQKYKYIQYNECQHKYFGNGVYE